MERSKRYLQMDEYLSLKMTNCIKGIFASVVLIHHLYQYTEIVQNKLFASLLQVVGYLSVSVFFFLSGYGVAVSTKTKGEMYILSFPRKRILPLYINTVIILLANILLTVLVNGEAISPKRIVTSFLWGGTEVRKGWYLQTIILFYVAYYFIFRFVRKYRAGFLVFNLFLMLYCVMCLSLRLPWCWYVSVFAMPLGMLWFYCKEPITSTINKHYFLCLVASFAMFALILMGYLVCNIVIINMLFLIMAGISFVTVVAVLIYKMPVDCLLTRTLGKYFFEIYVLQGLVLDLLRSKVIHIESDWLYCALCIITLAVLSVISHPLFTAINRKFKKA